MHNHSREEMMQAGHVRAGEKARATGSRPVERFSSQLDRVFIRDLVLDARIGIHDSEQKGAQRVRVSVEAGIPPAERGEKIANTLCYDYIIDGIRDIVRDGHIKLAETLAERIAAHVLAHPLACEVLVRVEKLDRVPQAALGVEIFRRKQEHSLPEGVIPLPR